MYEPGTPDREEIYRFRYTTYVIENDKTTEGVDHRDKTLIDPIDEKTHLIVCRCQGEITGTISLRFGAHRSKIFDQLYTGYFDTLDPNRVAYVSRLMVAGTASGRRRIADALIQKAFWSSVDACMSIGLIHGARPMIRYFQRWGFRPYGNSFDAGFSTSQFPMAIATANEHYFREIGSPLIESGRSFPQDSGEIALFNAITSNQLPAKVATYE